MKKGNGNRGLVKAVLMIIIALIIAGYFGYNLRHILNSPAVHDNLVYAWGLVVKMWHTLKGLLPTK